MIECVPFLGPQKQDSNSKFAQPLAGNLELSTKDLGMEDLDRTGRQTDGSSPRPVGSPRIMFSAMQGSIWNVQHKKLEQKNMDYLEFLHINKYIYI